MSPAAAISIRPAVAEDAAAMVAVLNPIIRAGVYTVMTDAISVERQRAFVATFPPRGVLHVADAGDGLLGLQDVLPASSEPALDHVGTVSTFVALDARRRGIGAALTRATVAAARARGFRKLVASIRADNAEALAFYRGRGFTVIGTARRHARIGERYVDEVLAERWIGPAHA